MKYLFDENMPPRLAEALRVLGQPVVHVNNLDDLRRGSPDEVVIKYASRWNYRLISLDRQMTRTPHLKSLILTEGVGAYYIHSGKKQNLPGWELARLLISRWDDIKYHSVRNEPPYTMLLKPRGALCSF